MPRPAHGSVVVHWTQRVGVRSISISSKSAAAWVGLSSAGGETRPFVLVHGDASRLAKMCGT